MGLSRPIRCRRRLPRPRPPGSKKVPANGNQARSPKLRAKRTASRPGAETISRHSFVVSISIIHRIHYPAYHHNLSSCNSRSGFARLGIVPQYGTVLSLNRSGAERSDLSEPFLAMIAGHWGREACTPGVPAVKRQRLSRNLKPPSKMSGARQAGVVNAITI